MRSRQSLVVDTARHVQGSLDDNAALVGSSVASSHRNLDDVVPQLTTLSIAQSSGKLASRGATARQKSLRATLRTNGMKPIAEVAKQLSKDVPEFQSLRMPPKPLGAQLVHAATAMADVVTASLDAWQQQVVQTIGANASPKAQWKSMKANSQRPASVIVPSSTISQNTPTPEATTPAQPATTAYASPQPAVQRSSADEHQLGSPSKFARTLTTLRQHSTEVQRES